MCRVRRCSRFTCSSRVHERRTADAFVQSRLVASRRVAYLAVCSRNSPAELPRHDVDARYFDRLVTSSSGHPEINSCSKMLAAHAAFSSSLPPSLLDHLLFFFSSRSARAMQSYRVTDYASTSTRKIPISRQ